MWKFDIKGMEYGPEEKVYLTRRILELSQTQWEVCTIYVSIQLRSDTLLHNCGNTNCWSFYLSAKKIEDIIMNSLDTAHKFVLRKPNKWAVALTKKRSSPTSIATINNI